MVGAGEALSLILSSVEPLGVERVPAGAALGRVLAEKVLSGRDIPGFDNSAMDGFAVRSADLREASRLKPLKLKVVGTVAAGSSNLPDLQPGEAARTMTGAPICAGADAVIPVEQTRFAGDEVEIFAPVLAGFCVRPSGEDVRRGEVVFEPPHLLRAADIGLLAALGRSTLGVYRRPTVGLVCTGDELVEVDEAPAHGQVVNSSAYALAAAVSEAGGLPIVLRVAPDRPDEIRRRFSEALAFDAVISTGGVSVGDFDHVKTVLDELGMRSLFHGVAQRPGKPLKFGLLGGKPVFGMPGNPTSTLVCFYVYAWPALRRMGGHPRPHLPALSARCEVEIKAGGGLTSFVRVTLRQSGDQWFAGPAGSQGSGLVGSLSRADGLLVAGPEKALLRPGDQAPVLLLAPPGGDGAAAAAFL